MIQTKEKLVNIGTEDFVSMTIAPLFITLGNGENIQVVNTAMKSYVTKNIEKPADIGIMKNVREKGVVPIYTEKRVNQERNAKS